MFEKNIYIERRRELLQKMAESAPAGQAGILLFVGNTEAAAQYKDNAYKFRQDSSWLYYFGLDEPLMAAVLDVDDGTETLFADDVEIGDIIWMGPQPSVASKGASVGIAATAPYAALDAVVKKACAQGRPVHFLPPSRYYNTMKLADLVGIPAAEVPARASQALVKAVVSMRLVKRPEEIAQIDDACALGYEMHTVARQAVRPGIVEQEIVGKMEGVTLSKGWGVSFPTILTQHGETLHNHLHDKVIEPGKLMVIDAGAHAPGLDKLVAKLTDKPLMMALTHGHGDHVGGIVCFPEVWIHPEDEAMITGGRNPYKGTVHHLEDGDVIDLNRENIKDFDVREFYVQLVSELKEKGL